ncbi:MAG: NUDIX domain-containing protein [Gammaproteobacteria bacterium]
MGEQLEPCEPHLDTVKRELLEETGYVAAQWTRLCVTHPAIGYTDETIETFLARQLTKKAAQLDAGEFLEVFSLPLDEAIAMIRDGRITDSKTVIGLLWLKNF